MGQNSEIDVAVIGAGPAGMTAALYAKRKALSIRLFDALAAGGQASDAIWVENYLGFGKIRGFDLVQKMAEHLKGLGLEPEEAAEITGVKRLMDGFELDINDGEEKVRAKAVVLCTGRNYKMLRVPGEKELYGKGLSYCATCDGPGYKGKRVGVVGAGNSGANAALYFDAICEKVYLVEFMEKPMYDHVYEKPLKESRVEVLLNTQVLSVEGKERVSGLRVKDRAGGKESVLAVDAVFVYIGMDPKNDLAKQLGLKLDKEGHVVVNRDKETSVKGVFAAGDITGELAQTIVAAGSGAVAAVTAFEFVKGLR